MAIRKPCGVYGWVQPPNNPFTQCRQSFNLSPNQIHDLCIPTRGVPKEWRCQNLNKCSIDYLGDVNTSGNNTPLDGQVLTWNASLSQWIPVSSASTFTCDLLNTCNISDLSDVDTNNIPENNGQTLIWNTTTKVWERKEPGFDCDVLINCSIDDLGDVAIAGSPTNGQVLTWNDATNQWENDDIPQGFTCDQLNACTLENLGDVALTPNPQIGDVLTRTASGWTNAQPSGGGFVCSNLGTCSIDALQDVQIFNTPNIGQVLAWNDSGWWENINLCDELDRCPVSSMSDVNIAGITSGQHVSWSGTELTPHSRSYFTFAPAFDPSDNIFPGNPALDPQNPFANAFTDDTVISQNFDIELSTGTLTYTGTKSSTFVLECFIILRLATNATSADLQLIVAPMINGAPPVSPPFPAMIQLIDTITNATSYVKSITGRTIITLNPNETVDVIFLLGSPDPASVQISWNNSTGSSLTIHEI